MMKHVLGSHGMPRLHRFLGDVYELDGGEAPEILSPDHESRLVAGQLRKYLNRLPKFDSFYVPLKNKIFICFPGFQLNGKDEKQEESPISRPIRAVRSRQNTVEEISVGLLFLFKPTFHLTIGFNFCTNCMYP